jgi:hypothetical protein
MMIALLSLLARVATRVLAKPQDGSELEDMRSDATLEWTPAAPNRPAVGTTAVRLRCVIDPARLLATNIRR